MFRKYIFVLLYFCSYQSVTLAQEVLTISGYVMDNQSKAIELTNVKELNGTHQTQTGENGFYTLQIPIKDTVILQYNCLGYQTATRIIPIEMKHIRLNITLASFNQNLKEIVVQGQKRRENNFERLDASKIRLLPDATGGSIEALLVTYAGVASNNELSSQYSVRGGNYDENLVYVNGTEVYRPLLIRAGQQEGLSFVNPEMVQEVKFSSGGFDATYGDKMSSVLDIQYKKPTQFESVVNMSLLEANLYVGQVSKNKRFTQIHGLRYKTNAYLLGTLDTKAEYNPSFFDYQSYLTWKITPSLEWSFLGNVSKNAYEFIPRHSETAFGTFNQRFSMSVDFEGKEQDAFRTLFGAMSLSKKLNSNTRLGIHISYFNTLEDENYDIAGLYSLSETPIKNNAIDTSNSNLLGRGKYLEHARNHLNADVLNFAQTLNWKTNRNEFQSGFSVQRERIKDNLNEWEMRDSAGYSLPYLPNTLKLYASMKSTVQMESVRFQGFLQERWHFRINTGQINLSAGIRGNFWTYNKELLISPRISFTFVPDIERDYTFRMALGTYYQAPFYKELRDTTTVGGRTQVILNQNIKAQKTTQIVAGMEHSFIGFDRPFKLTTELYYKDMRNLIPYTVDNVRIRYLGKNMAKGYTTGIDAKLFGELVPGTDSWISLSLMQSRETIGNYTIPRPNEQRYTASIFFQDYFPNDPKLSMNLKIIWADGLPFGPPNKDKSFATLRLPPYRRIDIGLSRLLVGHEDQIMKNKMLQSIKNLWLGVDCFNLFNIKNTNSYYWVTDFENQQLGIPNFLTGRLLNFRISAEF